MHAKIELQWSAQRSVGMRIRGWAVLLLGLTAFSALITWRVGFRCRPLATRGGALCYSWFRPHLLVFRDSNGQAFYIGVLDKSFRYEPPASQEYVDLGNGKISLFATNQPDDRYGLVKRQEISTRQDGRVD